MKKALTNAVIFSVCAVIWTLVLLLSMRKYSGTTVLIIMICVAFDLLVNAVIWFVRYNKLRKKGEAPDEQEEL